MKALTDRELTIEVMQRSIKAIGSDPMDKETANT